jgi:hypothetical protein
MVDGSEAGTCPAIASGFFKQYSSLTWGMPKTNDAGQA